MEIIRKITLLFALIIVGLFVTGCSSHHQQNPKIYKNKVIKLMNRNTKDMRAMNTAMTQGDYQKAKEVRKAWEHHLKEALKQVKELGEFRGSAKLEGAVIKGLKRYKKIVSDEYIQLIAVRSKGDSSQQAKENRLIKNINKAFTKASKSIHKALDTFEAKYAK